MIDNERLNLDGTHVAMVVRKFSPSGGLELYTYKLVEGLLARKVHITIICEEDQTDLQHALLSVRKVQSPLRKLSKAAHSAHFRQAATDALSSLNEVDLVHSQHVPMDEPDVVTFHNHSVYRLSRVGYAWEKLLNNAKLALRADYKMRDKTDRQLVSRSKVRIFVSGIVQREYYDVYGLDAAAPYKIAYPGSDLSAQVEVERNTSLQEQTATRPFTFLFVGKGYRKKGLDVLLRACSILRKENKEFQLHVAGLKEKAVDRARLMRLGLTDTVHFLGFRKDMDVVYKSADVAILPSRVEPFGMAPIQAMSYGLAAIVSANCGVSELLSNREDCLILENHLDPVELASHMSLLINDRALLAKLSNAGHQIAAKTSWDSTVEETMKAYAHVLSARAKVVEKFKSELGDPLPST